MTYHETLAYLAGVMDSDGCFGVYHYPGRNRGRFSVHTFVSIKQVQIQAIELLQQIFGGKIRIQERRQAHHRPLFTWRETGKVAMEVCQTLLPYLQIKRRQAEILLEIQAEITAERHTHLGPPQIAQYPDGPRLVRRSVISDESLARRAVLLQEIKGLNTPRSVPGQKK